MTNFDQFIYNTYLDILIERLPDGHPSYNGDGDFPSVLPNNSKSLLDILISDSSVIVVNSSISYKDNVLAFLTATATLKSSSFLILYSRYYFILYS